MEGDQPNHERATDSGSSRSLRRPTRVYGSPESAVLVVTVRNGQLDGNWLGKVIADSVIRDLELAGVDPCGERGEIPQPGDLV